MNIQEHIESLDKNCLYYFEIQNLDRETNVSRRVFGCYSDSMRMENLLSIYGNKKLVHKHNENDHHVLYV
jgi:hypothetical protein